MAASTRRTMAPFALALAGGLLAGCAAPPPVARVAAPPAAAPAQAGLVLGRNERFVVYQAGTGDTLRSIAARFLGDESREWALRAANDGAEAEPGRPLVVPLRPPNPGGVEPDRYQTVPILCYHRFGTTPAKMVVTPANFALQLAWLADNGYHVVPLAQLAGWLAGRDALPPKAVVITIDDGYESVWKYAVPLLREHGFPATLFVYPDFVGAGGALSWPQLQELAASGLVDVQSHSKSHRDLIERAADETDARYRLAIEAEVRVPHDVIEKRLQVPQRIYAYPYGDANDVVLAALARQHYELGVTVNPGGNPFWAQPLLLRRTMIFGDFDLAAFKARLTTSRPLVAP
jgi:peptidoglycan/xylan/chitin deacetylase (PgdA/CDA1 family)